MIILQKLLQKITENKLIIVLIIIEILFCLFLYFYLSLNLVIAVFFGLITSTISIYSLYYNDKENKENLKFESDYPIKKELLIKIYDLIRKSEKYDDMEQYSFLSSFFEPIFNSGQKYYLSEDIQNDIEFIIHINDLGYPTEDVITRLYGKVVKELKENYNF